jgi:hypothetical protein
MDGDFEFQQWSKSIIMHFGSSGDSILDKREKANLTAALALTKMRAVSSYLPP